MSPLLQLCSLVVGVQDTAVALRAQEALASGDLAIAVGLAAVGGFLTALSPCVYPLIPITLSVFGARDTKSRAEGLFLALAYTLGMVLLYAILGTMFASMGKVFGTLLARPVVVLAFAIFCVAMALAMLGVYELRLPAGLQTRLANVGGRGYRGAFTMGVVSGLIAAPCTGPVLSVLLTFIASTKDTLTGFVLMLGFGGGLGLPFLVLATFSSAIRQLPKSGAWMEYVKGLLGVAMLALALYYLQFALVDLTRVTLPPWLPLALIATGLAAGALHLSFHDAPWHRRLRKLVSAGAVGAGLFFAFLVVPRAAEHSGALRWESSLATGLARAEQEHKPSVIDFFATWCAACVELDEKVFSEPEIIEELHSRFVSIKVDGTEETDDVLRLYAKYGVKGLPTVVFLDAQGRVLEAPRLTGFVPPGEFKRLLRQVK